MARTRSEMEAERNAAIRARGQKLLDNQKLPQETRVRVERAMHNLTALSARKQASKPLPPASPPLPSEVQPGPSEPRRRSGKWIMFAVAGVSECLILIRQNLQPSDPEARLGLLIYGPVIAVIFTTMLLYFFDFVTRKDIRRVFAAKFSKRPLGESIDILQITLMMGFLGLIFLSGIGVGPEKSNLFIFLPLAIVVAGALRYSRRK